MQTHGTHLISLLAGRLVRHARHIASTHPQRAQRCRGARIRCARRGSAHEPCQSQHNQDAPSVAAAIACDPAPSGAAPAASRATRNTRRDGGPRCRESGPLRAAARRGAQPRGWGRGRRHTSRIRTEGGRCASRSGQCNRGQRDPHRAQHAAPVPALLEDRDSILLVVLRPSRRKQSNGWRESAGLAACATPPSGSRMTCLAPTLGRLRH